MPSFTIIHDKSVLRKVPLPKRQPKEDKEAKALKIQREKMNDVLLDRKCGGC